MSDTALASYDEPLEAVLIQRRQVMQQINPDVKMHDSVVLKDGPQAFKVAIHWVIVDRHTGEIHHHSVQIETYKRLKKGWKLEDKHTVTLEAQGTDDEIMPLLALLSTIRNVTLPDAEGDFLVVPVSNRRVNSQSVRQLLQMVSSGDKARVLAETLAQAKGDPQILNMMIARASEDPDASEQVAAALNAGSFRAALEELKRLVATNASESDFQKHLAKHPWIFGSEYSELLDQRKFTRNQQQDYMLRRTTDNHLELIEIKTPLDGKGLFLFDRSHDTYYMRSELSEVLGQVMQYIEKLDGDVYRIRVEDNERVSKIRAKIIIGRDGDEHQSDGLRRLNGHLHRVEVITFDQLVRVGEQVVKYLDTVFEASRKA